MCLPNMLVYILCHDPIQKPSPISHLHAQQSMTAANYSSDTDWFVSDQEDELLRLLPATPTAFERHPFAI